MKMKVNSWTAILDQTTLTMEQLRLICAMDWIDPFKDSGLLRSMGKQDETILREYSRVTIILLTHRRRRQNVVQRSFVT